MLSCVASRRYTSNRGAFRLLEKFVHESRRRDDEEEKAQANESDKEKIH